MKYLAVISVRFYMFIQITLGYKWMEADDRWYYISSDRATFDESKDKCYDLNGYLTTIEGDPKYVPFRESIEARAYYYVGARFNNVHSQYEWVESGEEVNDDYVNYHNGDYGDCVSYRYNSVLAYPDSWKLKNSHCDKEQRYICKSYNQKCSTIRVTGFQDQTQYNGDYITSDDAINMLNVSLSECDISKPIFVHTEYPDNVYVCVSKTHHKYYFYQGRNNEAHFTVNVEYPHHLEPDKLSYEKKLVRGWMGAYLEITCLSYATPLTTIVFNTDVHTTAIWTESSRITGKAIEITSSLPEIPDKLNDHVMLYMNIAIWTLVGIFIFVDVALCMLYRRLLKRKET